MRQYDDDRDDVTQFAQDNKKKTCIHDLVINGTNLMAQYRKQLLVLGITNFNNPSARIQANRYNDLYRELERSGIRDSVVRVILVNEADAARHITGNYYDKIRIYQDNSKDHLIKKLRNHGQTIDNFVFGRCGYVGFTQEHPNSNLEDGKNYRKLLQYIKTAIKNKRRCQRLCS
ncbi:unnamed protein product [Rotaria sordida]|uniref:Selenoprotein P N-terminal domain-containing protein n=1 Tax=Rotaria sordida TaxID=392033 RepID=A0A816DDG4_9BILA|nr:unnamed protein product [Rotaria sordida]CAF1018008.1 unnamed protein product [Rotaria sordida]CAF1174503.1 unnamed protein product [Rotaria sordida]CAF1427345.1 unnamed protein product [Rotaria sordida]CAF1631615.1 unnamed protein product [Rotaria sordida]